jgi:uncharacterized spore protein YtfJ
MPPVHHVTPKVKKANPKNSNQRAKGVRRDIQTTEEEQRKAINDAHGVSVSKAAFLVLKKQGRRMLSSQTCASSCIERR